MTERSHQEPRDVSLFVPFVGLLGLIKSHAVQDVN